MSVDLERVAVRVVPGDEEVARARMLDLAPQGFEEVVTAGSLELAVYTDAAGAARIRACFPDARATPVTADWEHAWQTFHRGIVVGGVWIGPPWEESPRDRPSVVIDPGRAFGTGAHATTRLCIELLGSVARGSLLDVGCGSGVLAIAGARLGFAPVIAIDADPVAVEATTANAAANDVAVAVSALDALHDALPAADTAVANVLLAPVEGMLHRLDAKMVVTSGYLAGERPAHSGWTHVRSAELGGWAADVFRRATV